MSNPQQLVEAAYAAIGRTGVGSGMNQIDQEGRDYWVGELQSGRLTADNFRDTFNKAVNNYIAEKPNSAISRYVTDYVSNAPVREQLGNATNRLNTLNTNYGQLQQQLSALQTAYDQLARGGPRGGGGSGSGGIVGGGVVDTGGSSIGGGGGGAAGSSGPVWGPDGRMFSSIAAALSAGVTNFSFTRPAAANAGSGLINGANTLNNIPSAAAGNANPGAAIAGANSQLFNRQTNAQLPAGVSNPFAV